MLWPWCERYCGTVAVGCERSASPESSQIAHQREDGCQPTDGERDRQYHVKHRDPRLTALIQQYGIERECREGGVAAENARCQEQAPVLRDFALEGEVADQQTHHDRAAHIFDQGRIVEARAEPSCRNEVDTMAQGGADATAQNYDQESHDCSLPCRDNKKPPCGGSQRTPTAMLRGRSHQPSRQFRGTPSPSRIWTLATGRWLVNVPGHK